MTMRTLLLCCALALPIGVAPGPPRASADEKAKSAPVSVDLSGRWVYNRELSDDAHKKVREGMEGRGGPGGGGPGGGGTGGPGGGGMGGPGGGGMGGRGGGGMGGPGGQMGPPPGGMGGDDDARESMRAIFEPAEELAVTQAGTEIGIDEKFGRTRRLHPDGKKYKTDNGASEIKTSWKEGKLLVETKGTRGGGVVETWELVPDRSRIIVMVRMEGGFGPRVELKRIYDRAKEGEPR
jgi:hypothetical protein